MKKFKVFGWVISLVLVFAGVLLIAGNSVTSAQAAKKGWKALYREYLEKVSANDFPEGKFIYIDNNSVPELYLQGSYAAVGNRLLTVYNGKLYEHYIDGHGGLMYMEKKNRYYTSGGHMDIYFDSVGKLKKGKMVALAGGNYGAEDNSNVKYDKNGNPIYSYYWNGKKVSKTTYDKKLKAALKKSTKKYKSAYEYGKMDTIEKLKKAVK